MLNGEKTVKSVRMAKPCEGCETTIHVGESAIRWTGVDQGIRTCLFHPDCRTAEIGLNREHRTWGGDWMSLQDMEWEDWAWLLDKHPTVAARMGITQARYEEERLESEEIRAASRSHDASVRARMDALIAEARRQAQPTA